MVTDVDGITDVSQNSLQSFYLCNICDVQLNRNEIFIDNWRSCRDRKRQHIISDLCCDFYIMFLISVAFTDLHVGVGEGVVTGQVVESVKKKREKRSY